ncbi:MAG: hypothetical protein PHO26_03535 [Dehalococcoidia bacterium]|nr:hypothetical protein [Dehalococcoidia bacterium]MDD5494953.1 hypothetical protein [Dehalococcoidia bacterium]
MKHLKTGYASTAFLLFALLTNLVIPCTATAGSTPPLKWERIEKPGKTGNVIVCPSEINQLAISYDNITNKNVIFVVDSVGDNITPGKLYRTDNGGTSFIDMTKNIADAGAQLPLRKIGVAPDQPKYVAVTDNVDSIYLSTDSGSNWIQKNLPVDNNTVQCISISSYYPVGNDTYRDVAVGTANWGDNITTGKIWTLRIGKSSTDWQDEKLKISTAPGAEISAVTFSSQYYADPTILVVASTGNDAAGYENRTFLFFGQKDPYSGTSWGNSVEIDSWGDAFGVDRISSAISLPSDYNWKNNDPRYRLAFISYDRKPDGNDDVYRIWDYRAPQCQRLNAANGAPVNISSIAYYGTQATGKLLAGEVNKFTPYSVQVKRTSNPLDVNIVWNDATQPPSGPGNARVAWSNDGNTAYCGTGTIMGAAPFDESAFSISSDNGDNWDQISLINTDPNLDISDIAPAPDSRSLFMATYSEFGPESIWRSAGEPLGKYWGRNIFTIRTLSNRIVLRLSPEYSTDSTIYAVEVDDNMRRRSCVLGVSHTRGNYWTRRVIPLPIIDLVVENGDTLYIALNNGSIRKSTDEGIRWGEPVNTGLTEINMLAMTKNKHLLVGSRDGEVAYSTDGGSSFQLIPVPLGRGFGDVQVEADARYASNNLVYAAAAYSFVTDNLSITDNSTNLAQGIWRWTIGRSTQWEQIDGVITNTGSAENIGGLKAGSEGTLYALRLDPVLSDPMTGLRQAVVIGDNTTGITQFVLISDNGTGGMSRTLNPTDPVSNIEFDILNRTLPAGTTFDLCQLLNSAISDNFSAYLPNHLAQLKISGNASQNDLWAVGADNLSSDITYIYRFQDNVCKVGPLGISPAEVGCDPVSGRNQQVDLKWEQLSVSDEYELRLAKDGAFTLRLGAAEPVSNPYYMPAVVTSPAYWVNPGIQGMECGRAYYWQVRTRHAATTEFIRSPWSVTRSYDVKPGFPVTAPYLCPQLLAPENGCRCSYDPPFCFSWTPYKGATKYKFELSEYADMSNPLISWNVTTTAYQYDGELKRDTSYFWRVMELEPVPGDWSAVFNFSTSPSPMLPFLPARVASVPLWAWAVLAIGSIASIILVASIIRRWREPY